MTHLYVVSFNNDLDEQRKIFVNSDKKLSPLEITSIKNNSEIIQNLFNEAAEDKKILTLEWQNLRVKLLSEEGAASAISPISVTEIAIGGMKKLRGPAFSTKLQHMLELKPARIPLVKFVWKLMLAPLIGIHRFMHKNRDAVLQNLRDLDQSFSYDSANQYLKDYEEHLNFLHSKANSSEALALHLKSMQEASQVLRLALLDSSNNTLIEASKFLASQAFNALKKDSQENQSLLSLPGGFYENGKFHPLLASLYRNENKEIRLELNFLGYPPKNDLPSTYKFDELTEGQLTNIIFKLSALSTNEKVAAPTKLTRREKIRLKVLRQFNVDEPGNEEKAPKAQLKKNFDPTRWLYEAIATDGGIPVKISGSNDITSRNLISIIGTDIEQFFPEAPAPEKVELLIKLVEEHYEKYVKANPYLTSNQQEKEFQLLKFKIKKLENHLMKRVSKEDYEMLKKSSAFDLFFKKIEQLEILAAKQQKKQLLSRDSFIDNRLAKSSGEFSFAVDGLSNVMSPKFEIQSKKSEDLLAAYAQELTHLRESVSNNAVTEALEQLTSLQKKADKLIDKKKYYEAKQLSIQILQTLPVPNNSADNFWRAVPKNNTDTFTRQIADINKHIWESALRLQEEAPTQDQLLQMLKSQVIISAIGGLRLDQHDLLSIIELHPHYRFGWLPSHQKEISEIQKYLQGMLKWPCRYDLYDRPSRSLSFKKQEDRESRNMIAMARVQCMTSSLLKPEYTLYPFYGKGQVNSAMGVNYLDWLVKEAVNKGAKTPREKSEMIKAIKYQDIQKRLAAMGRLDVEYGDFVTETPCVKIIDHSFRGDALCFAPNIWGGRAYGLKQYEKKYHFYNDQSNTRPQAGAFLGEETYLARKDEQKISRSKALGHHADKDNTLTQQKGHTEPTLLAANLQRDPIGQVSQAAQFTIDTAQIASKEGISYQSVYELLNLIRTQTYLLSHSEFQRTILLNLVRPGFLMQGIQKNPLFFEILAEDLHKLIEEKIQADNVAPFLILLGDTIAEHAKQLEDDNMDSLIESLPRFDSSIQIGDIEKTGEEWLFESLKNAEKSLATTSLALIYSAYKKPLDRYSADDLAHIVHAATIFETTSNTVGIPQFNVEAKKWIQEKLIPYLHDACEQDKTFVSPFFDQWIRLAKNDPAYSSTGWEMKKNVFSNADFEIDLHNLHIRPKAKGIMFEGQQIPLPHALARFTSDLFGTDPIKTTLRKGGTPFENYYDFSFQNENFSIYHNQASGEIHIYRELPVRPQYPHGKKEWFQYLPQKQPEDFNKLSAIEHMVIKNGLWINTKTPQKGYVYAHAPQDGIKESGYEIQLDKNGKILQAKDPISKLFIVLDKRQIMREAVSFANPETTLFLAKSPNQRASEIRFLDSDTSLQRKGRGKWVYHNEKLGEGNHWLTDLSDEQLLLRERSGAKAFLDCFEGMQDKFILPVSNGKTHTFIIHPYPIVRHKGVAKIEFDYEKSILPPHAPPLTITFDSQGKQEGNPSAFLYLAYYFAHIKNYRMAEHYLNLAKKAASTSASEVRVLENLEGLFDLEAIQSLRGTAFQLKAQLAIKHVKTHQLSQTLYTPANSGEFLANLQHIGKLYKIYQKRAHDLKEGALTAEELYEIKHYVHMSMIEYIEKYEASLESKEETLDVKFSEFAYFTSQKASSSSDILTFLLMTNLDKKFSVDELITKKSANAEFMIRHFIHFMFAILEAKKANQPDVVQKIQLFLNAPKNWEVHDSKESEENLIMAKFAHEYLKLLCLKETPFGMDTDEMRSMLKTSRKKLPFFARNLGIISAIFDVQTDKLQRIQELKKSFTDHLKLLVGDARIPLDTQGTHSKVNEGEMMTSLAAILAVLDDKVNSGETNNFSPLELNQIRRMIESGNYDKHKAHKIVSLLRESEAHQFSVLDFRSEAQNMLQIQKLEEEIKAREPSQILHIAPFQASDLSLGFDKIRNELPSLHAPQDATLQKRLDALNQKVARLETYFQDEEGIKKTLSEENKQLRIGLQIAKEKLQGEINRKTEFSKNEIQNLKKWLTKQAAAMYSEDVTLRTQLLNEIKHTSPDTALPSSIQRMVEQPEIYTDYDLFNEILRLYKKPCQEEGLAAFDAKITEYLFKYTAYLQVKKAQGLLSVKKPSSSEAGKALQMLHAAFNEKRYEEAGIQDGLIPRVCLVAEARDGFIYRPAQLLAIKAFAENPNQWASLIMGIGKTSVISPSVVQILAELGYFVVSTVPETLLKGNRQSADKASRALFDQANLEFSVPLSENLSHSLLAEKYLQLLKVVKENGYVVTSVEEICTLHNLMIQLEEQKRELSENPWQNRVQILVVQKKLHYIKKMSRLIHGEAHELKIKTQFFGDEVDTTHDISHEVNLATGAVSPPNIIVRKVARSICELILNSASDSKLHPLKQALFQDSQSVLVKHEMDNFMKEAAILLQQDPKFLEYLSPEQATIVQSIPLEEWTNYITGSSSIRPEALNEWNEDDDSLKYLAAAKQMLSQTFKQMLAMKSGNDFGLSDYNGFLNVPKVMKNETPGMRFGDEFDLVVSQYLGYLEYLPVKSLTDKSEVFLTEALKTYQNKYPTLYKKLIEDYVSSQTGKTDVERLSLLQYLKSPEAWSHRFNLLDEIIFDGGYITRFDQQISTNVQDMFHGKSFGGVTGTLDPYTLPYISDEIQFNEKKDTEKVSTREVEAETLLRMTLNLEQGIDTPVSIYDDQKPLEHLLQYVLNSKTTKGFVNNSGASSEGLDMLAWIETIRQAREGASHSYYFRHPQLGTPFIWPKDAREPVAYKGQTLSEDYVCLYGPNDTRGVDQPIGKGDVHFFIGATTPLQELMQTLYRARRIGDDHKIILHIPKTWADQLKPQNGKTVTYGDVARYIVSRTADSKEGINESAQLEKITGQLKAVVSRYLRQTNPQFDKLEFWDENNLPQFAQYVVGEVNIFNEVRNLYIKNKQIYFQAMYEPLEKITGTAKILNAFDDLASAINTLIDKLPEGVELEGKTDLIEDLKQLKIDAETQKANLLRKLTDHERFLPEQTSKSNMGSKGVKEQVKELQQEKMKAKEVEEEEPANRRKIPPGQKRNYIPLNVDALFQSSRFSIEQDPEILNAPFDHLQISREAQDIMKKMDVHKGDPLLYLAVAKNDSGKPVYTMISKQDYHQTIFPALREGHVDEELHIFSVNTNGFSQIDGTSKFTGKLPSTLMAFKCYLGIKEYPSDDLKELQHWVQSLSERRREELNAFLKLKGTQTLYDLIQELG
ncbi:hypothetical protein [Parachlamydia acanthamoebae]|uniref:Uncharacterized protein n=1 Tax=Parachlamydia acanthamoebae TaxID=83552 RepID=A0A0C1CCL0_9BACT|nr:hypothetical protein [Parachlamydia acanthamoebae]KIA78600.1 hypothetical protein DB43_DS00270 [Parachlamydia acanthamoebae]